MKSLKYMPILSLALAIALSMVGVVAMGAPSKTVPVKGTHLTAVTDNETKESAPDTEGIYRVLMANRLFGGDIYNDEALIEEAQIALIDQIEIKDDMLVINRDAVNSFIRELYGREIQNSFDGDYYVVGARGYDPIGHEVTEITRSEDGKVIVRSMMTVGTSDAVKAVTVLSPCQNRFGYMLISADIVE